MIPNNIYYRRIAQILNNTEYEHFYSTLYYMKRIAQSFGETYTGFNPSNKYLKDWAIARGVTDDEKHHINRYWLHKIALTYDDSTLAGKIDNYYLKKIYDRLNESPVASTIKIYIDDVEVDPSVEQPVKILSKADDDSVTYKLEVLDNQGNPYEGYSIPLSVGGVAVTPTPVTDAEGIVEYTYHSQGVGDTNISINCTLVSKTFVIIDGKWYNNGASTNGLSSQSGVSTTSDGEWVTITTSTSGEKYVLTPISFTSDENWEFSCKCKTSSFNSQALGWQIANENSYSLYDNRYLAVTSPTQIYSRLCGSAQSLSVDISDNDVIRVQRVDGYWKIYVNDTLVQTCSHSWSGNKTISFYTNQNRVQHLKEILIKPL